MRHRPDRRDTLDAIGFALILAAAVLIYHL